MNRGINIAGEKGSPIGAAAAGTVVYAGSGLPRYGNLLIIKHDETYLSAYAHCERLLVEEGGQIQAGQTIATIGDAGTSRVMLHFEIRKNGKPINPRTLLPAS